MNNKTNNNSKLITVISKSVAKEIKLLWNGVNPAHGTKTIIVSTKTGNIIKGK